jgi:hypothetical protein
MILIAGDALFYLSKGTPAMFLFGRSVQAMAAAYSYRSASIGSSRDAFHAG